MTLRQLRAFVQVAREGSIARAAQVIHLTPSALSMLVGGLEAELGIQLFERTPRRMVLSEAGRELLPTIEEILGRLQGAVDRMRELASRQRGSLVVAASPLLAATLLPPRIAEFRHACPGVSLSLLDLPVGQVAECVRSGHADVGVVTSDAAHDDLDATVLFKDRLMLACRADHPLARRPQASWLDLASEPLALLQPGSGLRTLVERGFATLSHACEPAFEVTHVETALGLVESGLAVSILPWYALSRARPQGIVAIALSGPVIHREIVALTSRHRRVADHCKTFIAQFRQAMDLQGPDPTSAEERSASIQKT